MIVALWFISGFIGTAVFKLCVDKDVYGHCKPITVANLLAFTALSCLGPIATAGGIAAVLILVGVRHKKQIDRVLNIPLVDICKLFRRSR
jgi:hypothetical protein